MAQAGCKVLYIPQLLDEFGFMNSLPAYLLCDNRVGIHIASDRVFHEQTKYIKIDYYFILKKIQQKIISTRQVKTEG